MATKKTATKTIKSAAKATKARATQAVEQAQPTMSALFARAKDVASSTPMRDLGRSSVAGVGLTLGFVATSKLLNSL